MSIMSGESMKSMKNVSWCDEDSECQFCESVGKASWIMMEGSQIMKSVTSAKVKKKNCMIEQGKTEEKQKKEDFYTERHTRCIPQKAWKNLMVQVWELLNWSAANSTV